MISAPVPRFCAGCDERLGVVASQESFFGCVACESDLALGNMIEVEPGLFSCLRCVLSMAEFDASEFLLVALPLALNLSRMAARRVSMRSEVFDPFCPGGCGRRTSFSLARSMRMDSRCFVCMTLSDADVDFTRITVRMLRLMYVVFLMACSHDRRLIEGPRHGES